MSVTGAPFAPYTHDLNVGGGGGQVDVAQAQGGEICHAHPGLDHGEQHSVVAPTRPATLVRRGHEGLDLGQVKVGDALVPMALGWDRDHPCHHLCVLGVAQRGVPVERVVRG
ncbi:MAG: hypothetical protein WBG76_14735 [Ornithinimicrobium sp.]